MAEEMMTVPEAAKLLRMGKDKMYALARDGKIPSVRIGRAIRIPRAALLAHIERQATDAVRTG